MSGTQRGGQGPFLAFTNDAIQPSSASLASGGGPPHDSKMEHRIQRLEEVIVDIRSTMATREDVRQAADVSRSWGMWAVGAVIATGVALAGLIIAMNSLFMQASGNQLSAFQAGLSTIQAVASARDMAKPPEPSPPTK